MKALVHGITLAYDDHGTGTPVVFLHGFPLDRSLWSQQVNALAPRVRCIVPDLRGFGESDVTGPYSMRQYADDVIGLLDVLDLESAVICGLSMGGYIAMALWKYYPTRVRALVLCDTRAGADSDVARGNRDVAIGIVQESGAGAIADRQLPALLGATTRERQPELVAYVRAMMARQPVEGIVGALGALRDRPDSHDTLRTVTVPTLVLVGEVDTITPLSDAESIMAVLPEDSNAQLDVIDGAGHLSCLERPAAVTHALADFLAAITTRAY